MTATFRLILVAFFSALIAAEEPQLSPSELIDQGEHEGAISLLKEYIVEFEKQRTDNPTDASINEKIARILIWQGTLQLDLSRSEESIASFESALSLLKNSPPNPRLLGTIHDGLGRAHHHAGQHEEAENAINQALTYRQTLPEEQKSKWVPATREHLGLLHLSTGRYEEAGKELQLSLSETEKSDLASLAQRNASLGRYFHTLRNYSRAREHLEAALEHAEGIWGREAPNTLMILDQLGLALLRQGETAQARAIYEEAINLAAKQATNTVGGLRFATISNNFGNLLIEEREYNLARSCFQLALSKLEETLEPQHAALAPLWSNLAYTNLMREDYKSAFSFYEKARDSYLTNVGPLHQRSVEALNNLALASFLGKSPDATKHITAANAAHRKITQQLLSFGTETQRLNYLQRVDPYSLPCSSGESPQLIANTLIQSKGRLLDTLLSEKAAEPSESSALDWQTIQASLIPNSALIDFIRYQNYHSDRAQEIRYGAILLLPTGPPKWIPLGTEDTLISWLNAKQQRLAWRSKQLNGPDGSLAPPLKLKPALRRLYDEFWAPIASALPPETQSLALCPDASLNFLSFATLLDENKQFFCQKYDLALYLTSARDLLSPSSSVRLDEKPWHLFAIDQFSPSQNEQSPRDQQEEQLFQVLDRLHPIVGANKEVDILQHHQSKSSRVYRNQDASEQQLRSLTESPAVLHLITHGFLLPGNDLQSNRLTDFDESPGRLARSGLVLFAPDATRTNDEDDILYSREVAKLPLADTRLVTLSSCDSGLGEELSGEGILGLRRGFALAGADNLLLALWPVSDATTPEFMDRFYQIATHTNHLSQAAWQTQRELLAKADTNNEADLELATLNYGPFVLCQREALQAPPNEIPAPLGKKRNLLWIAPALGLLIFLLLKLRQQRVHSSAKSA